MSGTAHSFLEREVPMTNQRREKQSETVPVQGETQERSPRMPHERDESADSQEPSEPSSRAIGQVGHDDVERGVVDSDKSPELDRTYDKVREGADDPVKKFTP